MEAYTSHCPSCGATYNWTGYKTGLGKSPQQLEQMRRDETICKRCGKPGLETRLDRTSPVGREMDAMYQHAAGLIGGILSQKIEEKENLQVSKILARPYSWIVIPQGCGRFAAHIHEFKGCLAEGDSPSEAIQNLQKAADSWVRACIDTDQEIPPPVTNYELPMYDERCPMCGNGPVTLSIEEHQFEYGDKFAGHIVALLSATIPVYTCGYCNRSWLNECGEALKEHAVKKHLEKKMEPKIEVIEFRLRRDFQVSIVVPQNITKLEVDRLMIGLKTQLDSLADATSPAQEQEYEAG